MKSIKAEYVNPNPEETKQRRQNQDNDGIKGISLTWIKHNITKWVWAYHNKGFNLIPIGYKTKIPHKGINKGEIKKWQYERQPKGLIQEWLDKGLFEGVAILGGKVSGNLICFDFDNPQDFIMLGLTVDSLLKDGAWVTETPKEPGRYHIVIRDKNEIKTTRLEKHVDYRANEHYWLVYPSIHPNGKQYNFLNTHDPDKLILPAQRNTLALFETWNDILNKKKGTGKKIIDTTKTKTKFDKSPDCIRNAWQMGAEPGSRYYVATGLGSWLQQQKFPLEMAQQLIIEWFKTKCDITGRPIKDIKNACAVGYEHDYKIGCSFWRDKTLFCPYEKREKCKFYNPKIENSIEIRGELQKDFKTEIKKEKKLKFSNGLLGRIEKYVNNRTNAPIQYATHMGINIIGHAMGVHSTHFIQPDEIHHNTYVALIGESTIARKTTVQDLMMEIACQIGRLPSSFSPEGLLKEMQDNPQGLLPLGEFSTLLRGIRTVGYMANIKEILNELHGCPPVYSKRLSKMKDGVVIDDPYLCVSTTCTPEEFLANLTNELIYGGMLARFILVPGNAVYRPRERITKELREEQLEIRTVIWKIKKLFEHPDNRVEPYVHFEFTKKGLEEFNRIDKMLLEDPKWEYAKPFVGRYLNYLIVYGDILMLSDLIEDIGIPNFTNLTNLTNLTGVLRFVKH